MLSVVVVVRVRVGTARHDLGSLGTRREATKIDEADYCPIIAAITIIVLKLSSGMVVGCSRAFREFFSQTQAEPRFCWRARGRPRRSNPLSVGQGSLDKSGFKSAFHILIGADDETGSQVAIQNCTEDERLLFAESSIQAKHPVRGPEITN